MFKKLVLILALVFATISPRLALALETVTAALTSKAFQYVPLVIAQERGYMKEEGLDLKLVFMQNAAGLQALIANQVQFSGSGSSALVAISKGNAPLKTVLAFNDQVLQWIVARPNIKTLRDLSGKKSRHHRRRLHRGLHAEKYFDQTEYSQRHRADRSRTGQSPAGAPIRRRRCGHRQP